MATSAITIERRRRACGASADRAPVRRAPASCPRTVRMTGSRLKAIPITPDTASVSPATARSIDDGRVADEPTYLSAHSIVHTLMCGEGLNPTRSFLRSRLSSARSCYKRVSQSTASHKNVAPFAERLRVRESVTDRRCTCYGHRRQMPGWRSVCSGATQNHSGPPACRWPEPQHGPHHIRARCGKDQTCSLVVSIRTLPAVSSGRRH